MCHKKCLYRIHGFWCPRVMHVILRCICAQCFVRLPWGSGLRWRPCSVQSISLLTICVILYKLPQHLILAHSGCLPPQVPRAFGVLDKVCRGQIWKWNKVTSRFLWGSGLMLELFSTFIDRLEKEVNNEVTKFASDTKLPVWQKSAHFFTAAETHHGTDWALQWIVKF